MRDGTGRKEFLSFLGMVEAGTCYTIAAVGAGGKTSLLWQLCREAVCAGKRVIVTTTTHMAMEKDRPFIPDGDFRQSALMLEKYDYVLTASVEERTGKLAALPGRKLYELRGLCDILLIEADGAGRMPLKVPREWEPVIPPFTDMVIGVLGLDSLEGKIKDRAHHPEHAAAFLGKEMESAVTPEDLLKIACSDLGLRKDVGERRYLAYFNKADVLEDLSPVREMVSSLVKKGVPAAYGSLREGWIAGVQEE